MYDISVIIPTYNREKYIGNAVESVLTQEGEGKTLKISEVLIIDDGSTDKTESVIKGIKDSRINYIRHTVNRGAIAAWNEAIYLAKGDWIAFQDSDDEWHRDKLLRQTEYLEMNPSCDLVCHPFEAFFSDGTTMCTRVVEEANLIKELAINNFIGTPTMLVRRSAITEIGGFDPEIKALQDWDFALRFANRFRIGMIPDVLLNVNMSVEGMSADAGKYYESRCRIISGNRNILIENGCFDEAVTSLFEHAKNNGILEQVGKMLELYLKQ